MNDRVRALLQAANFAHVTTLNESGTPHTALVWVHAEGDYVELNSAVGRRWPTNADRAGRLWILVADHSNPYEYVSMELEIVERTTEGGDAHIDKLARKYWGRDYDHKPGETRVIYRLSPVRTYHRGG